MSGLIPELTPRRPTLRRLLTFTLPVILIGVLPPTVAMAVAWSDLRRHPVQLGLIAALTVAVTLAGLWWARRLLAQVERQLLEATRTARQRSEVVWAVGHELRNPLTMINASASILLSRDPGELTEMQDRFVTTVEQQARQGIAICEDILAQARIETGTYRPVPSRTDLVALVRETGTAMESILEQRQQRLFYQLPRLMEPVSLDARAVRQALTNLLLNASRHSAPGSTVELKVLDNDSAVVLQVVDSGDGMTAEEREHLFEPFRSGAVSEDGVGLGLSITKQLVEANGGRMMVDTRQLAGTAFMVTFPRARGMSHE